MLDKRKHRGGQAAGTLSVYLLGSFRVLRDGQPVNGSLGGKGRQLLKVLAAHHNRCLPKDVLIEMLWPEGDPAAAAISLKVAAHNLRSALEPNRESGHPGNWVIGQNGSYRLNMKASVWIDALALREHHARGVALEATGFHKEAREQLTVAESLYAGDYLEEDVYDDWTVLRREELRDVYLDILGRLASLAAREQAHAEVISLCHKIVLADSCREDAYRMLIQSHAALNQIARAGAWYAVCRSALRREVGSGPSAETVRLFEELFEPAPPSRQNRRALA